MAYKSIFTALTGYDDPPPALAAAAALAQTQDAHLDVMCLGVDSAPNTYYELGATAVLMHAAIDDANAAAKDINEKVTDFLEPLRFRWEAINSIVSASGLGRTVAVHARFTDIGVVGLPYGDGSKASDALILEGLLFDARCPTLVVPAGAVTMRPSCVVIGWNESPEAIRAVQAAMPFLKRAATVQIAVIDPPKTGPERSDPGGALAVYLSRHGVKADIQVMSHEGQRVSERLMQHVQDAEADLLVMGAYGHSRFREAILGGATRELLEISSVPVLMAH